MVRLASLWAALLSAAVYLVASPAAACDTQNEAKVVSARRQGRTVSVLDRIDRVIDTACKCDKAVAAKCGCSRPERRVFEKLSGSKSSPELPKDARYDASAGVFL